MSIEEIESKVITLTRDQAGLGETLEVNTSTTFVEDLGFDSLDAVELVMELEDHFGVAISDEAAEKIATVGDAIRTIDGLLNR